MSRLKKFRVRRWLGIALPEPGAPGTIGSILPRPGEVVRLSEKTALPDAVRSSMLLPRLSLPSFLPLQNPDTPDQGIVRCIPDSRHISFGLTQAQVVECYARRGV